MAASDGSSGESPIDLSQFVKNVKNSNVEKKEEEDKGMLGKLFDTYSYMTSNNYKDNKNF